jgi:hypothetical protein
LRTEERQELAGAVFALRMMAVILLWPACRMSWMARLRCVNGRYREVLPEF